MAIKYLATTGIDTPTGGAIGAPFATYDYALLHTTDDDLILARGGDYNQYINNTACNGLSTSARRRIANYPGETVWMKPTSGDYVLHFFSSQTFIEFDGINMDARGNHFGAPIRLEAWEFGDPHHINIKNATIILGSDGVNPVDPTTGGPMGILAQAVFAGRTGAHGFYNLKLQGGGDPGDYCYGMYIETHDCIVDGCEFDNTGNAGIQIYNYYGLGHGFRPMRNIIRNSYFHDITRTPNGNVWGIIDAGDSTKIYSNRFLRIGGANGAAISLFASLNPEVYNNSIYNGTTAGIKINPDNPNVLNAIIRNNIAYQNAGGNYIPGMGVGTIEDHNMFSAVDPKWVNPSAGDFRLQSSSPAIGAGIVVPYATTDYLGNARSTTFDIGAAEYMPPGSGPSNQTAATAINLGILPASVSQNVHDSGTTYTVWYKYTAVAGDVMIGVWGFGGTVDSGYQPYCEIFGPNNSTSKLIDGGANNSLQVIVVPGSTYYFKFNTNNATITPANLAISVLRGPNLSAPTGSICIPDDNPGFPTSLLSVTDGQPLKWITPFPSGENTVVLPNGIFITSGGGYGYHPMIYNPDFSQIAVITALVDNVFTCNRSNMFYHAHGTGSAIEIRKITSAGVNLGVVANLPFSEAMAGMALSPDESILYYKLSPGTYFNEIKRHNLTSNTPLSNLAGGVAGYYQTAREILCLADGTIISNYTNSTGIRSDYIIKRYNPDGSVANTYISPGGLNVGTTVRLAHAIDDPNSFWVWYEQTASSSGLIFTGQSFFLNIKVSDGSILKSISGTQYEIGEYRGPQTLTPVRFGHSQSCAFFIMRDTIPPVTPDISGIYYINPTKVTKHDSYYYDTEKKIPDPTIKTALLGE